MVRIVLAVDDPVLASQLTEELGAAGLSVFEPPASDLVAAVCELRKVCIADRAARNDRGVLALRAARGLNFRTPFIFIDPARVATEPPPWLGRGVISVEPFSVDELVRWAQDWARREAGDTELILQARSIRLGRLELDPGRVDLYLDGQSVGLSPIQFRLLYLLAERRTRYVSPDEITEEIWGRKRQPGDKHIVYTVQRIRRKVRRLDPSIEVLDVRKPLGYRLVEPSTP